MRRVLDDERAGVPVPGRVDPVQLQRRAVLAEQAQLVPGAHQRRAELGVVDVRARAVQQVAVKDRGSHKRHSVGAVAPGPLLGFPRMSERQLYRLRAPSTGRELLVPAEPGKVYTDYDTGEPLEVVGKVLPPHPSRSSLPWAVETLRCGNWCDEPAQRTSNDRPTRGRRMAALPR